MKSLEMAAMQIISMVGTARSYYIEAIRCAKADDIEKAYQRIHLGDEAYRKGQKVHAELLQREAEGVLTNVTLLLAHAEDQLMSAETFHILSKEWIDLYEKINSIKESK